MEIGKKIKSILFISVLSLICLSLAYVLDVNDSLGQAESSIEVEPQEIKKAPFPPETTGPEYAPDEILVKFKPGVKRSLMAEIHARFGMVKIREIERIGVHRLRIPPGRTVPQMVQEYRRNPNIEYAEPNYVARKYAIPDDPYYINQWAFYQPNDADIDAQEAWDIETGTSTIIIAIIDDGIDYNHEEFPSGKLWINPSTGKTGYDFGGTIKKGRYYIPDDDVMHESATGRHGTCTAGIASAATNNGLGVAGTCWNATIMPLKVEDGGGFIYHSYIANAITFAADNGAHILSMSLGGPTSSTLADACGYAWDTKGKVLLASSGNENTNVSYPAAYSTTIAIGATNESDERCTTVDWGGGQGSNYGPELDVVAPGNNIYAPDWSGANGYVSGDYYAGFGGTSASCPMAAGLAALILSQNPGLTNIEVRNLLRSTAEDLVGNPSEDTEGFDNYYGYGRINAYYALLGGPPLISKIVFITPPRSAPVNSASEVMTIQTQDSIGSPIAVSSDTAINLISTSGTGKFSLSASPWSDTSSLIISKGEKSASFYYEDSTVSTPTITVSESPDAGWTDAIQEVHITFSQPDLTLTGTTDIEFSNQTPEPFEVITISATIHNNGASYHNQNIDTTPFAEVTSGGTYGYYVDVTQWDGQSFTAISDGWLAKVSIDARDEGADVTDPERFFQVRIQGDDNGKPDGNDLSSVESYDFAGSPEWHDFVFSRPARIVNGVKYWIVANSLAPDQNGYLWRFGGPPDAYAGGGAITDDTSDPSVIWGTESSNEDFWFKTYTYTYNTIVQFYDGDPDSGGTQIGSDQNLGPIPSIETGIASVNWTAAEGTHQIYVHVDRPNYITESDDTNNKAYKTIIIVAPPISSATNQTFTVDDPATAISTITITDDPISPTITAANDIRIKIPSTFNMEWDTSDTIATIGGGAASKVSTTVSYEDSNKTLVIDVTTDFAASDQITISDLSFTNFSAGSVADNLELEVDNAGTTVAYDDKTIKIKAAITKSFQDGVYPTAGYNDTRDTYLDSLNTTTNYGAGTNTTPLYSLNFDGDNPEAPILIKWDISDIPAGSIVSSATITFVCAGDASDEYELYEMKRNWVEGDSTSGNGADWGTYDGSTNWQTAGAQGANDRGSDVLGTILLPNTPGQPYNINLNSDGIALVQAWINGTKPNYGIIIQDYVPTNGGDVYSREHGTPSYRPKLTIEYTPSQTNVSAYTGGTPTVPPSYVNTQSTGNCLGTFRFYGSGSISKITITEYGTCDAINDLDNVKLFKDDGDGNWELGEDTTQLGLTTTFSGASSTATFSGFSLVAYSTCYVHVVLDVKNTATVTDTIGIEISASTDVTSTKTVTASSWPVQLGTAYIGQVVVISSYTLGSPSVPPETVYKDSAGNCMGTFRFDGSGTITEITITQYGTCDAINDLENVKLFQDDGDGNWEAGADTTQLDSTTNFNSSNEATFSSLSLTASATCYVHIVLDVNADATDDETVGIRLYQDDIICTSTTTASSWPVQLGVSNITSPGVGEAWTAYNDCGDSGNTDYDSDDPNVTNFGAADSSGNLKKYSDGSDTGVSISYSGNLNEGTGAENEHTPPCYPPSGDATTEFGTKINVAGISYCTTGNSFSVTLSGVSSSKKYTLVALGMRGNSTYDRESKYVISDVSSFTNSSSAGTTISTTNMTDDTTIYHTDDNWNEGYVAKWTNIVPTSNSIVFTVYPVDAVDDKGYLSAIKLVEEGVVDQTNVSKYASGIPTVPSSTVDKGTTGNCLGTFKFDGAGTISEITITEYGTCDAINDLDNVKLFKDDGDGNWELGEDTTQLGLTTTFSGASSTATFSGFSLVACSTCYVHVVLDVKNTATVTDTIGIEISASTDVTSTKYVTAYSWPVQLGTSSVGPFIDVSNYTGGSPSVPPGTVYKQSTENCLGTFRFDGSGTISQITIIEYGTCDALSDLENVKLFQDDGDGNWESGADTTQLGSTINFNSSNEATFSSLDITASGTCYVHVVLDVNSNAIDGETVGIELYQDDIVCTSTTTASGWPVQLGTSNIATYTAGATVAFICDARPRLFGDGESQLTDDLNQMDDQMGSGWTLNAVVTTGDMDYISAAGQQTFDDAYAVSDVNTTPVFYAVGNHEIDNSYDMPVLRDKFSGYSFSPNSGPANCEETTYSYDVGDIHVAVINEYYNGTSDTGTNGDVVNELFDWLKDDLRTTTKPYKVVAAHEPAYPEAWQRHVGDSLDGYPDNRDRFWNLLKTERALAYFCGHTHVHKFQEYDGVFECDAGVSGGMVGGSGYDDFATIFYAHFDETDGFQIRAVKEDPSWASPTVVTKTRADLETQVMVNTAERAGTRCSYFIDYDESNPDWSGNNSSKWWESAFSTATANWSSGELCVGYDTTLAWPWMNTAIDNKSGVYGVFVRVPFTCYDKSSYYGMKLQVDCDDAVTVWLNGTQIYKTANSPDVGADDIWDKTASSAHTADGDADKNPDYANGTFDITSYLSSLNEGSNLLVIGNWNSAITSSDLAAGIKLSLTKEVTTTIVSGYHDGTPTVPPSTVDKPSTGNCFGTFKFDGVGTVSQITLTEYGTCDATTELENVKLFQDDGDGDWEPSQDTTQIGSVTTFSGASSTATFSGFNLTVGAACYVHVVLDVKSTATQDNTIGIEILQAFDITSDKDVTASSWPVQLGTSTIKDATAPEAVTTLSALTWTSEGEIKLTWTSPGDDGWNNDFDSGSEFDIRYSTTASESPAISTTTFASCSSVSEFSPIPTPVTALWSYSTVVTGLTPGVTYYFAIRTRDEVPNWSGLSNGATTWAQVDVTAPESITTLTAQTGTTKGEIDLTWTAPGDDGITGDIVGGKYRVQYSTNANVIWDKENYDIEWSTDTSPGAHQAKTVTGLIQGTTCYFCIWTADEVPNWSSLSNRATSQSQVAILSISVSTDTYNFGEIPVSSSAVSITSVIVTNNGNVNQTYSLKCSTSNPGHLSPIVTSPGWDEFRLSTIFNSTATSEDFAQNDALTLESQTSSGAVFAKDEEGDQTGVNVPVDTDINLWLKFESPWKTAETAEQEITITISAEMAE